MNTKSGKTYLIWILLTEAVGGLSGWLTRNGSRSFNETVLQPKFSPPAFIFPVVWGILYALMGISAARIYLLPPSRNRSTGLNLYFAQLIVNFFWSLLFFNAKVYGFSLLWLIILWVLVLSMILIFYKTDKKAAFLQIPYIAWLTFAAYLNWGVWKLNP